MKSIVEEIFGSKVFDESVMREKLAKDTYRELEKTIRDGKQLNIKIANAVAHAMKEWALEQGATHYTHWLQLKSMMASSIPIKMAKSLWNLVEKN